MKRLSELFPLRWDGLITFISMAAGNSGNVSIIVALALVGLIGCASLVTDVGLVYVNRTLLQNAVDAASLAGAQELPASPANAQTVAINYAANNGVAQDGLQVSVASDNRSITVTANRNVQLLFARALGLSSEEVDASATAESGVLSGVSGVVPFSIPSQLLVYGQDYDLKVGSQAENNGWFQILDLDGKGGSVYQRLIEQGYPGVISVGETIPVVTGDKSGPTTKGVSYRIGECPNCTFNNFPPNCPRLVIVPIVTLNSGHGGNQTVTVNGFAAFFLESVSGSGKNSYVTGRFIKTVYPGSLGSGSDYGVEVVKLVK